MEVETVEQAPETQEQAPAPQDPFAVDESVLSTLTPEARVAYDTTVKSWREKADAHYKTEAEKRVAEVQSKYKDYDEKAKYAEALQQLASDPRFAQWYQATFQQPQQPQMPQVASPEDWAVALAEASSGSPQKMQMLLGRQFQAMAAPTIRQFQEQQTSLQQDRELDSLFRRHPDADELDDPKIWGEGKTPLELAIHQVVDREGKSFEEAYQVARQMVDAANTRAKNAALGMVNEKKESVTEAASKTSKETENIIEVASAEEALRKNVEAAMKKQNVTYVAKPKVLRR